MEDNRITFGSFVFFTLCLSLFTSGCGRYIPAVSPTVLVPTAVQELSASLPCVTALQPAPNPNETVAVRPLCSTLPESKRNIVTITWLAPEKDLRGKELKELIGYSVEQYNIVSEENQLLSDKTADRSFTEIKFIPDTFLSNLTAKRKEAEERGDIMRRVKISREDRTFSFTESQASTGTVLYRIIPVNREGGEGPVERIVQVTDGSDNTRVVSLVANQ